METWNFQTVVLLTSIAASVVLTGCLTEAPDNGARSYEGFGNYERTITTEVESAQRWCNQGMQLMYGFNHDEAFAIFREGVAAEDALVYDEPPACMLPLRHAIGALLMANGRHEEAEAVYREDLRRNHDNGWSLTGLQLALKTQKHEPESDETAVLLSARLRQLTSARLRRVNANPDQRRFAQVVERAH